MTQDESIELARQAGFLTHPKNTYIISKHASADEDLSEELEAFAKLVAEKEREACAKIAEKEYQDAKTIEETHYKYSDAPFNPRQFGLNMDLVNQSKYLSFEIRARGQA